MIVSNISFGRNVSINPSAKINNVEFGDNIKVAKDCFIMGSPGHVIKIGTGVICAMYLTLDGRYGDIEIGEYASVGQQCVIKADWALAPGSAINKLFDKPAAPIKIGAHTWIGSGRVIAPGVTIGDYSIVAANSYVDSDVPPYSIAGGNPARIIRAIDPKEIGR